MPFFILSILIQVALVVHIVKTGRDTKWIWIVVTLPLAGSVAYLLSEVLPDVSNTRAGREAGKKVKSVVNPNKDINQATKQFAISDTIDNSMRLAQECLNKGLFTDAKSLYTKCLKGAHVGDAHLMFGLARSSFELGEYVEVKATLDSLIEINPEFKNADAHLLYARTLEKLNEVAAALEEYEALHGYFPGPEASYYFAKFLKKQNQNEKAKAVFQQIVNVASDSGKHYNSIHKEYVKDAKKELSL